MFCDLTRRVAQAYGAGFPTITSRISWLFLVSKSFTTYLDLKKSHPRQTDCPGSFHSRQSSGTVLRMFPLYGKYFTQPPSLQLKLFLGCNPIRLIFKVLTSFRFLFIRSSVASDSLRRSNVLYDNRNQYCIKF